MKLWLFLLVFACANSSVSPKPVENFDLNKYLGTWHEIARIENRFEKNCTNVTANYSLRSDGGINVLNKCVVNGKEKTASAVGYFYKSSNVGLFKVAFFWPFYAKYNISYVDENYQHAIVDSGRGYLWILARQKTVDTQTMEKIIAKMKENDLEHEKLMYTKQD